MTEKAAANALMRAQEQMYLLVRSGGLVMLSSVLALVALAWLDPQQDLLLLAPLLLVPALLLGGMWLANRRERMNWNNLRRWRWLVLLMALANGVGWGLLLAAVLDRPAAAAAAVAAGSMIWLLPFGCMLLAQQLYAVSLVAALLAGLLISGADLLNLQLPVPLLAYLVFFLAAGWLVTRSKTERLEAKLEQVRLQRDLSDLHVAFAAQDDAIKAEMALRQSVEEALRQANKAAETANRAKTEFLATISHEIRTPLNGILPILELLLATELDKEQRHFTATAYNSSRHLLRLINDILDFSKAEVGKLELETIEIDLQELVQSVAELMRRGAEQRGLTLTTKLAKDVPRYVRGDPFRLRQILTNLVSNAVKFTEKGGISVEVSRRRTSRKEVELMFTVRDTGIGMTEETAARLFRPFAQADASTTRKHGGTGLGLVICRRLVELMGGKIGVRSRLGKGAIFWFILPIRKSVRDVPTARHDLQGVRMLVLGQETALNTELMEYLKGWRVTPEHSVEPIDAIAKLRSSLNLGSTWAYEMLIIDAYGMEESVAGLVRDVRALTELSQLSLVVVNCPEEMRAELIRAGADVALARPLGREALRTQLYRQLDVEGERSPGATPPIDLYTGVPMEDVTSEIQLANKAAKAPSISGRVLLVEDNPVNMAVARKLIERLGLTVDTARDGLEALEALRQQSFDLVLMDCQMPNMDGYEATAQIRASESGRAGEDRQVIIAMTANAMEGDRDKCLQAGMDDYLAKPLNLKVLRQVLTKWLPGGEVGQGSPPVAAIVEPAMEADAGPSTGVLDLGVLEELREVMEGDFVQLLDSYMDSAPSLVEQLEQAQEARDIESMVLPAHSLKSSSANVGAMLVSGIAREIEFAGREQRLDDALAGIDRLRPAFDHALRALTNYINAASNQ